MTVIRPFTANQFTGTATSINAGLYPYLKIQADGKVSKHTGNNYLIKRPKVTGRNYTYTTNNTTNIDPELDYFYYIPQANRKASLGGNVVNFNLPYLRVKLTTGSKFGFEYIPTAGALNGGQYSLTTPTNADITAQGWTAFKLLIDGQVYSNGQVYTSKQGANPSRHMIASVNGTELIWTTVQGGANYLKHQYTNFNLFQRRAQQTDKLYVISGSKDVDVSLTDYQTDSFISPQNQGGLENSLNWAHDDTGRTTNTIGSSLPWSTVATTNAALPQGYRTFLVIGGHTAGAASTGTDVTIAPMAEVPEGIFFTQYQIVPIGANTGPYWGSSRFIRASTNTIRWSTTGTALTTMTCNTTNGQVITFFTDNSAWYAFKFSNN